MLVRGNISVGEFSEVVAVPLLLVLGPVRRADVVRRSEDVQEGGGTPHALNSVTSDQIV